MNDDRIILDQDDWIGPADTDIPMTFVEMARLFDLWMGPCVEDEPLDFDPDDYPII